MTQIDSIKICERLCYGIKKIFIRDVDGGNQNSPKKIILMLLLPLREYMKTYLKALLQKTQELTKSGNLVFMGGCALNCLANRLIPKYFNEYWIMPNPGDAGSSLGAVACRHKTKSKIPITVLGLQHRR